MKHLIQGQMDLLIFGYHVIKLSKSKLVMMGKKQNQKSLPLKRMEHALQPCSSYKRYKKPLLHASLNLSADVKRFFNFVGNYKISKLWVTFRISFFLR